MLIYVYVCLSIHISILYILEAAKSSYLKPFLDLSRMFQVCYIYK